MVNILIAEEIKNCKYIINKVLSKIEISKKIYISSSIQETLQILEEDKIDLIILNLRICGNVNPEIIRNFKKIQYYAKSRIFLIVKEIEFIKQMKLDLFIVEYSTELESSEIIIRKIKRIIQQIKFKDATKNAKNLIQKELVKLGFNYKYKGTKYLIDSILQSWKNDETKSLDNLEKFVYTNIAKTNNKSVQNIKTNIIKACNLAYLYKKPEDIKQYYGFDVKPTPKVVVSTILAKFDKYN